MAISDHRKFLPINTTQTTTTTTSSSCYAFCSPNGCSIYCNMSSTSPPLPPMPPLPPLPPLPSPPTTVIIGDDPPTSSKHQIHPALFVTVGLLGAFFVLFTCLFTVVKYCPCCRRGSSRSTRSALSQDDARSGHSVDDDDDGDDHGPVMDNPFWYINTVGLDRSVINSIAMFKYKTGDGLVEGTDCSVCLGEFRDDETLRLLPKCSHAFHVSCIDTWLRSHTNCPLCRARIVSATTTSTNPNPNPNPNPVGSSSAATATGAVVVDSEETEIGDDEVEICDRPVEELRDDADDDDREKEGMPMQMAFSESGLRALSDLAENLRGLESGVKKPVRRSVSMDFSSASILCFNKNSLMVEAQGGSSAAAQSNTNTNTNSNNLVIDHKRSGVMIGNPFFMRLKESSSIGRTLQKSPLSMKRSVSVSVSSGSKVSSWRHSRNRSFLLPL